MNSTKTISSPVSENIGHLTQIAKQEAQRKRKQQAAQAAEAQKRREGGDLSKDLFAAPTRATVSAIGSSYHQYVFDVILYQCWWSIPDNHQTGIPTLSFWGFPGWNLSATQ